MTCISATNPPVHKIGNRLKSKLKFHITRNPLDADERLDCILKTKSQMGDQRAYEEKQKSDKHKTEADARSRRWSHCE